MIQRVYIVLKRLAEPSGRVIFEEISGVYDDLKNAKNSMRKTCTDERGFRHYECIQSHRIRTKPKG